MGKATIDTARFQPFSVRLTARVLIIERKATLEPLWLAAEACETFCTLVLTDRTTERAEMRETACGLSTVLT